MTDLRQRVTTPTLSNARDHKIPITTNQLALYTGTRTTALPPTGCCTVNGMTQDLSVTLQSRPQLSNWIIASSMAITCEEPGSHTHSKHIAESVAS